MLESGVISTDQATELLRALEPLGNGPEDGQDRAHPRRFGVRMLRITIEERKPDGPKGETIRINIPLALARFAGRFLPSEAKAELNNNDIDLAALLSTLGDDLPDGPLVDLSTDDGAGKSAVIRIEVA